MSARRSALARRERQGENATKKCPKCKSLDVQVKTYPDAVLYICRRCRFPRRVVH